MYTNQLNFLSDVIQPRPTDTSMNDVAVPLPNDQNEPASETFHDETSTVHASKKRKGNMVEKKLLEALEKHNIRQKQKEQAASSGDDDDKLFLLSLVPALKSIPPHFKFAARIDIMQSINKFISLQSPAPCSQLPYNQITQTPGQHSGLPQWQYQNQQPGHSGVQTYQSGASKIYEERTESPLMSPISSYSQDSSDITLLF